MKKFAIRYNWYPYPCYERAKSVKQLRKQLNKEYGKCTVKFITITPTY